MKTCNRFKMYVSVVLSIALVIGCLVGCGKQQSQGGQSGEKYLEIRVWNSGNGTKHVERMIEVFKEQHPEYEVKMTSGVEVDAASFGLEDVDTVDLYIGALNFDVEHLEPLDDILDYTVDGENISIKKKFSDNYLDLEVFSDGHYYNLTTGIGGVTGIVYNKKLFEQARITQLPRTSDELAVVCDTLKEADITPLCHFKDGYYHYLGEAWFLQYEGSDYYINKFYGCEDENGKSPSIEVFRKKDGRYKTLQALEKIVTPDYVLTGSNSADHITMQTQFLMGDAAMMVNGSWLQNEMASVGGLNDFEFMFMPVISSITEKLTTVKTEVELRQLITAIDQVTTGEKELASFQQGEDYVVNGKTVSAADWDYVRKARHTEGSSTVEGAMYIPNYSDAKETAKEFIKFYYSDEGAQILADVFHMLPKFALSEGAIDTTSWNGFEHSVLKVQKSIEQSGTQYIKSQHRIFPYGGALSYGRDIGTWCKLMCSSNSSDRINANEAWENMMDYVDVNYEANWLANIK